MVESEDRIRLLVGAGIIVFYFLILGTLPATVSSLVITVIVWFIAALFIAPPLARLLSERLMGSLFGERGITLTKEYSRAKSLVAQGKFEEAIEEYRRGLEKEPDSVMLRLEIAEVYSGEMKDYRGAIAELQDCLNLRLGATQGASILNRMADIYETNLGDAVAAMAALRRIQETWPGTKLADRARERLRAMEGEMQDSE